MRFSPVSDKLEPRTRINVDFKPNKKMKKRRELDALVNNGKTSRRALSTPKKGSHVHELLRSGDDDDDDSNSSDELEFSLSAQDKTVIRKKSHHCRTHAACVPICAFLMVVLCLLVCGGLVWFLYELRKDINAIRSEVHTVESLDRGNPEEFQSLHSGLKALDEAVKGTKGLQDLDTQAQLSIKQNVASLGSAVKTLQTEVDRLLPRYSSIELKQTQLEAELQTLKAAIESRYTTTSPTTTSTATSAAAPDGTSSTAEPSVSSARLDALALSLANLNASLLNVDVRVSNLYTRVNTTQTTTHDTDLIHSMVQSAMSDYQILHDANMSVVHEILTKMNSSLRSVRLYLDKSMTNISDLSHSLETLNKTVHTYHNITASPTPALPGTTTAAPGVQGTTSSPYPSTGETVTLDGHLPMPPPRPPSPPPPPPPPSEAGTDDSSNTRRRSVRDALLHKFQRILAHP